MMVQDVQMKKRNRTGNGDRSDYIHRMSNFRGRFGKSDYRLIGGRSSGIVCQETAGRFHDREEEMKGRKKERGRRERSSEEREKFGGERKEKEGREGKEEGKGGREGGREEL